MSRIVPVPPRRRRVLVRATAQVGCYKARIPIPAYWDRELERTGPGSRLATGRRLRGSPGRPLVSALVSATTSSLQHVQLAVVRYGCGVPTDRPMWTRPLVLRCADTQGITARSHTGVRK